ncbi:MAG TPA: primosomal protein N' [Thermoanaerobaculaceae bacterium]|nr:primosomal protein N' [Thermoanaerobaculaceae bacterium]
MYARVALPAAIPEALTYAVPDSMAAVISPGCRVRVPLRGAPRVGLVLELTSEPGCPPERVQPVADVLDSQPLLPDHVLALLRFASEYYFAAPGLAVRAALPPKALALPAPIVELGHAARDVLETADPAERRLLDRLFEARRILLPRLLAEGWDRAELLAAVGRLQVRRAVRLVERRVPRDGVATVTAVALADVVSSERARLVAKAPAQARVLAWLEERGFPAIEGEVLAACGCSTGVVTELVGKGLVRRFQQARAVSVRRWELAPPPPPAVLSAAQSEVMATITGAMSQGGFRPFLLLGVTGSGKTEVYLRAAQAVVASGRQALVMVPEIGLTPALAGQLAGRFGDRVAVLHSSMAERERFAAWERARAGQVDVVAGPRSALWAPLDRLGLIVVDEEQDSSYKQDEEPRYNARDLALVAGQRLGIPVLLASATPSLEALALVGQKRAEVLRLPERVSGGQLPVVEVVDLRGEPPEPGEHGYRLLSRRAVTLLDAALDRDEQAIVLVNRRGWAPVLLCRLCGRQATCQSCSIPLTVHRRRQRLCCHYCGFEEPIPQRCPSCGGEVLDHIGLGTEKVAARVGELFPRARIDILDRDTARTPGQLLATLERFAAGTSNVLVGTQMVSKGHHFPRVTLTIVVNADNLLGFPDFRGAERTFQMLAQVAGRSGRGERVGLVVIQTFHPEHHAIQATLTHDAEVFAAQEMRYRQAFRYPPLARLAVVRFEALQEDAARHATEQAAAAVAGIGGGLRILGPAQAPLARLRERWRWQLLLLAPARPLLRQALAHIAALPLPRAVRRIIDVDPQTTV